MKLSIITVNLNNCEGLKRTINSVISQTFTDYEWIVIDGGSTDGSRELIEQYSDHFAYWCSEPDKGIYNAMNKGIDHAKGEWLQFLNSGDRLYDATTLSEISPYLTDSNIVYGIMIRENNDGIVNNNNMMKEHLHWSDFLSGSLPHQSTFTKRSIFNELGSFDESLKAVSDWKFFINAIIFNKKSYKYIPNIISVYEGNGISDSIGEKERSIQVDKIFPTYILDDLPKIKTYNYVNSSKFTCYLFNILLKITHIYKKFQK